MTLFPNRRANVFDGYGRALCGGSLFPLIPFFGTVSYNAQAGQVPHEQSGFNYGVLYADPLPVGGAGIPPTLLMQDMTHYLPDYLRQVYQKGLRGEDDLRVKICLSFQKSMFCVNNGCHFGFDAPSGCHRSAAAASQSAVLRGLDGSIGGVAAA